MVKWHMPGVPQHVKEARRAKIPNYGHRWCDREGFVGPSKGSPHTVAYLLCTVHGWMTVHEHYVCWLVAGGSSVLKAMRKVYWPKKRTGKDRQLKPKQKAWVADLKRMNAQGLIDLTDCPWVVYGYDIGDKTVIYDAPRRDYSDIGFRHLQTTA